MNPVIQQRIEDWSSDKEIAASKLKKLMKSLIEYAYKAPFNEIRLKDGRPEVEVFRIFGKEWVKDMYNDLYSILKTIKNNRRHVITKRIGVEQLVSESFSKYFFAERQKLEKEQEDEQSQQKFYRVRNYLNHVEFFGFRNPILICIERDQDLRDDFSKLDWSPSSMAKRIMAILLDIKGKSYQSLKDIIDRKTI